jgi:hypothetical protein
MNVSAFLTSPDPTFPTWFLGVTLQNAFAQVLVSIRVILGPGESVQLVSESACLAVWPLRCHSDISHTVATWNCLVGTVRTLARKVTCKGLRARPCMAQGPAYAMTFRPESSACSHSMITLEGSPCSCQQPTRQATLRAALGLCHTPHIRPGHFLTGLLGGAQ